MLIGFLGRKGHGKDTCADFVCAYDQKYQKIAFANALKSTCMNLFDLRESQLHDRLEKEVVDVRWNKTPREIMQEVATHFKDTYGKNFWINITLNSNAIGGLDSNNQDVVTKNTHFVISDVRFQEEIDKIHELGGIVIKIQRPSQVSNDEHISEKGIDVLSADYYVLNDGNLEQLREKIVCILTSMHISGAHS